MADELTTPTGEPTATPSLDAEGAAATEEDFTAAPETPPQQPPQEQIDLSVVQALREENKRLKEEAQARADLLALQRQQLEQMQQQPQHQQPQQQQPQTPDPLEGLSDDDLLDVKTIKQILQTEGERLRSDLLQFVQPLRTTLTQLQLSQQTPNYQDLLQKHLAKVVQQDPQLQQDLLAIPDEAARLRLAIKIAQSDPEYHKQMQKMQQQTQQLQPQQQPNPDAQRMAANAMKSGVAAQAGGSAALDKVNYYATMPKDKFEQLIQQVKNR